MTDFTASMLETLFRWLHVLSGVLWLGTLYFFAWVGGQTFQGVAAEGTRGPFLDVTERALFWARWSAAFNWTSGLMLLGLTYYHTRMVPLGGPAALALLVTFGGVGVYEIGARHTSGMGRVQLWGGWLLLSLAALALETLGLPFRAYAIHLGALAGSVMAFNMWFRIWPAQRQMIRSARAGEALASTDISLSRDRAMHNAYLSVPLLFLMVSPHASTMIFAVHPHQAHALSAIVLGGFGVAHLLQHLSTRSAAH